jgi:hypothetical protein
MTKWREQLDFCISVKKHDARFLSMKSFSLSKFHVPKEGQIFSRYETVGIVKIVLSQKLFINFVF